MVLADTSVWVRFLANRTPYAPELDRLLDRDEVAGHDLICGELLIGDPGRRGDLLKSYVLMHRVSGVPHAEVAAFVEAYNLYGRGIGWTDAHLLASAVVINIPVWTADERFTRLTNELGAGYVPSAKQAEGRT
jgi:predicted nucleic acid-binding protein